MFSDKFLGKFTHSFDDRSRLTVPSKFRDLLADGAYVVQGLGKSLWVFTPPAFEIIYKHIMGMNMLDPNARQLRELILGNASFLELDGANRILIPEVLRELVELKDEAILIGQGTYFEVWSPAAWAEQSIQVQALADHPDRTTTLTLTTG